MNDLFGIEIFITSHFKTTSSECLQSIIINTITIFANIFLLKSI